MAKLTPQAVDKWKALDKRQEIPDAMVPGLYLVVQPTGKKAWQVRYRSGAKHRRMLLGRHPDLGLADARSKAREALTASIEGRDPAAEREAAKVALVEYENSDRDQIRALVELFDQRHLSTLKSGATVKRELDRHVVLVWGDRKIQSIARRDVLDLLEGIADSGRVVTANRVRAYLGKFFSWCINRDIVSISPVAGVKPLGKEQSRDRVLTDDETRWFWSACEKVGYPWGPLAQTLLITGQRLGEVSKMTDREVTGDTWYLSADRTKNGRAHAVPLSNLAMEVLEQHPRVAGDPEFVFTTNGSAPVSGNTKGRNALHAAMIEAAREETGRDIMIDHWGFHDLRRTCATGMARLGIPVRVTEAVLNHASGTGGGIVAVYQRHDYAQEKRVALDAWANAILDLIGGPKPNVIPMRKAIHE
ncbi:MAG: tyrosine-type recombinase/integrase [Sulfitobacter geojensis]